MSDQAPTGFETWLVAAGSAAGEHEWLDRQRRHAAEQVRELGVPNTKHESWRYTSLKRLLETGFSRVDETRVDDLVPAGIDAYLVPGLDSHRIVMVNGHYSPRLSALGELPPGVRIGALREFLTSDPDALRERLNAVIGPQQPLFSALNTAGSDDGLVVLLERGAILERPIELIHLAVGMEVPRVAQPRHLIALAEGAQAALIERYISLNPELYCTNSVLELALGRDATLYHDRIQMESPQAFHITGLYLDQAANSHYQGVNIGLGGAWARTDIIARFSGEHAQCRLQGLYLAGDQQLMDYHLDVEHAVPNCTSQENFKGILYGKGRAVFDGRVLVARNAQRTDAAMSNKNLMLSEHAEVDTKPQLEIHADDVKCSHGTTVGQIDAEMLFYLRSRGLSASLARRMLCLGFAGEIIESIHHEAVREVVAEQVGARLESAPLD